MSRSREQALSFFETRMTDERGEGRELYRTPIHLIDDIIDDLLMKYPELRNRVWIDPCAADGIWLERARLKGIRECLNYDIEPLDEDVIQQDFLTLQSVPENAFIIGNPPFSLVKQFIEKALELTDVCYFLGGAMILTGRLSPKCKMLHRFEGATGNQKDLRSKGLFIDTAENNVQIWACGSLCDREQHLAFNRYEAKYDETFRVSPKSYCSFDERIEVIRWRKSA